jgi:hypothetical protein
MPLVGFKPMISVGERLQTHALDHAATGTSIMFIMVPNNLIFPKELICVVMLCTQDRGKVTESDLTSIKIPILVEVHITL